MNPKLLQRVTLPDDLLYSTDKLIFGQTVIATLTLDGLAYTLGCHAFSSDKMQVWGPELTSDLRAQKTAQGLLDTIHQVDLSIGQGDVFAGFIIDAETAFLAFGEGLILPGQTTQVKPNLYQTRMFFKGLVVSVYLADKVRLFENFKAISVDRHLTPLL